jgi:protein TonB
MAAYRRSVAFDAMLAAAEPRSGGRYGEDAGRPRWSTILGIVALHIAGLYALVMLDIVPFTRPKPVATVVTLIPDEVPPPPPASPTPTPPVPAPTQVVAPPPVVQTPVQAPPQVRTVEVPPPVVAPIVTVAAPVARPGPPAEAVVPPDFAGDQLGNAAPRYPIDSRRNREQGTVIVRVTVGAGGKPGDCRVRQSSGFERLDKAALGAVCHWKFQPATRAGRPVDWPMDVPIPFVLRG